MLAGAAVCAVAGRVLGREDLYVLAGAGIALPLFAWWSVRKADVRFAVHRDVRPTPIHVGDTTTVELTIRHNGDRRSPVTSVRDPLGENKVGSAMLLAPLNPGDTAKLHYRLPTRRRGIFSVGPLEVTVSDPFQVASMSAVAARPTQLTVLPHIDDIALLREATRSDQLAGNGLPTPLGAGEEFFALRAYQVGDDLRRVHWASTARVGELMIRQDEMPRQRRTIVLLDVRRVSHNDESLERAVSAAASILWTSWRAGSNVRLITTSGFDSESSGATAHVDTILEHLAMVRASTVDRLAAEIGSLRRSGSGGTLAAVIGVPSAPDIANLTGLRGRFNAITLVVFDEAAPLVSLDDLRWRTGTVVRVSAGMSFRDVWNSTVAMPSAGEHLRIRSDLVHG
jgi:uncharacterized protein (DUF58 family)